MAEKPFQKNQSLLPDHPEEKFSVLMRSLPGMAYHRRRDEFWTLTYASEGARRLFGDLAWEKIRSGVTCLGNMVHEESYPHVLESLERALARKEPYQLVYRVNSLLHSDRWVWDQGEGVYDEKGHLLGAEGFVTDFTAFKTMERELREEIGRLRCREDSPAPAPVIPGIIGQTPEMMAVFRLVKQAAASDAAVILYGASGTGKELLARAIHDQSPRRNGAFVPVNCGAIPENLMESEFFGYRKGAFSGADRDQPGILDKAHGGTLFLDEIGEIPLSMQTRLLRAIEGGGFSPVGSREIRHPDFRILAATNRNLEEWVRQGKMREDFFYRIHVVPLHVPSLKERKADIPLLVSHFLESLPGTPPLGTAELHRLMAHDWPGNVRELCNVIRRYSLLHSLDLPERGKAFGVRAATVLPACGTLQEQMALMEAAVIRKTLEETGFHRSEAARILGIDRRSLYTKMQRHGIGKKESHCGNFSSQNK
ncbi:PAS domain-containing protein [Desulfobotulus alkaliphilus]|uniref:PAS domain-containing protein n=1 Tax=Desulfobotulus alkaliphilus TaxID=622671 RepID=A0A562RT17_9BACT|nr:sigma 54-interacting transcriptional regulator [Desulfobotulus alkaliphilus]TWI72217.1 PAS domain-containing protein [Desulfobotulus alkaliphilus]